MNILFFCWEFPPNGSGIGRYISEMSSAMAMAGHSVTVLTSRATGLPEEEIVNNVHVLRKFDRSELRSGRVAQLAVDVAHDCRADWIEVPDHWGEGATLLKLRQRPPVVVKMHYNDVLKTPRYAQAWYPWQRLMIDLACLRQWKALRGERYSIGHADVLLAPCQRIFDEARQEGLRLPTHGGVVPNPIRRIETWSNAEAQSPTLLMIGRVDIGKGLPYIRPMLERLIQTFPDVRLEMAGGDSFARGLGSTRKWFEAQLGPLKRHVHLQGALSPAELDEAYRRAWVVIVPSRWDTFPQVILEAMVRSKAIVASCSGGIQEMLRGTSCAAADPTDPVFADAIARFISDVPSRVEAGQSGNRKALLEYSPECVAKSYITSCGNLL